MGFFDRFNKLWASQGQLAEPTPAQHDAGFAFLGVEPPTVEQFNALFQNLDAKDNWLYNQLATVITRAGIIPEAGVTTSLRDALIQQFADAVNRPPTFRRNWLVNGSFSTAQRGTFFQTPAGANNAALICVDRWRMTHQGGSMSVQVMSLTDDDRAALNLPGGTTNYLRVTVNGTGGANDHAQLFHAVESVYSLAGRTATVSLAARRVAGNGDIAVELSQNFARGTALYGFMSGKLALTANWQRLQLRGNIPAVTGRPANSLSPDHNLGLSIFFSQGTNTAARIAGGGLGPQSATFDIAIVQLEEGDRMTAFDDIPGDLELIRCMRYYQRLGLGISGLANRQLPNQSLSNVAQFSVLFPTVMRVAPTARFTTNAFSALGTEEAFQFANPTFHSLTTSSRGARVSFLHSGALPTGYVWHSLSDGWIEFDAEVWLP